MEQSVKLIQKLKQKKRNGDFYRKLDRRKTSGRNRRKTSSKNRREKKAFRLKSERLCKNAPSPTGLRSLNSGSFIYVCPLW